MISEKILRPITIIKLDITKFTEEIKNIPNKIDKLTQDLDFIQNKINNKLQITLHHNTIRNCMVVWNSQSFTNLLILYLLQIFFPK